MRPEAEGPAATCTESRAGATMSRTLGMWEDDFWDLPESGGSVMPVAWLSNLVLCLVWTRRRVIWFGADGAESRPGGAARVQAGSFASRSVQRLIVGWRILCRLLSGCGWNHPPTPPGGAGTIQGRRPACSGQQRRSSGGREYIRLTKILLHVALTPPSYCDCGEKLLDGRKY